MAIRPTASQAAVLREVLRSWLLNGRAPTVREVCQACGWSSPNAVYDHASRLQRDGFLRPGRALALTSKGLAHAAEEHSPEWLIERAAEVESIAQTLRRAAVGEAT